MLVIFPKRIICDSEWQYPHRHGDLQLHTLLKHCVHPFCAVSKYNSHNVNNSVNDCNYSMCVCPFCKDKIHLMYNCEKNIYTVCVCVCLCVRLFYILVGTSTWMHTDSWWLVSPWGPKLRSPPSPWGNKLVNHTEWDLFLNVKKCRNFSVMGRFRGSVRVSVKGYVGNREKLSKFSDRMPPLQ